jgi:hypothetical protein
LNTCTGSSTLQRFFATSLQMFSPPVPKRKLSSALLNLTNASPFLRSQFPKTISGSAHSDASASPPSTRPSSSSTSNETQAPITKLPPKHQSTDIATSISRELPIEVIQAILQELVLEAIPFTSTSDQGCIRRREMPVDLLTPLRKAQLDLLHLSLVSRLWYSAGLSNLYRHPHLFSLPQVQAFHATLLAKPAYAGYVRKVFILDPTRKNPHIVRNPIERIKEDRRAQRARKTIRTALARCIPVDVMHLHVLETSSSSAVFPVNDVFGPRSVGSHLRRLTLFGYDMGEAGDSYLPRLRVFGAKSRHLGLPVLETLCLRDISLGSSLHFPPFYLPRLRTLQIIDSHRHGTPGEALTLRSTEFPSLKRLALYNNRCKILVEEALASKIKELHLIGYDLVQSNLDTFVDLWELFHGTLRHLAIGGLWPRRMYGSIGECKLPATLETLRLVYQVTPDDPRTEIQSPDLLDELYQCLSKGQLRFLKQVVFHLVFPDRAVEGTVPKFAIERIVDKIGILFTSRNVGFRVTDRDKFHWINRRLEHPSVPPLA